MNWYNVNWQYRKQITIDKDKVDDVLSNFPVYLNLASLGSDFFDNVKDAGADIRITTSDGETEVPVEIVAIDKDTDTGELHFKAPSLSSTVDTVFYIYYRNSEASLPAVDSTYGRNNVWSDYVAVYHMQESSGNRISATGNNTLTDNNTVASATGKIGRGADFEANNSEYLSITDATQLGLDLAGDFTFQAWLNLETAGINQTVFRKYLPNGNQRSYLGEFASTDNFQVIISQDGATANTGFTAVDLLTADDIGIPRKIDISIDISVAQGFYYKDGELFAQPTGTARTGIFNGSDAFRLGATSTPNEYFDGIMDEVRIKTGLLSAEWISTEYNNQSSPATFYEIGQQEENFNIKSINGILLRNSIPNSHSLDLESGSSQYAYKTGVTNMGILGDMTLEFKIKPETLAATAYLIIAHLTGNEAESANCPFGLSINTSGELIWLHEYGNGSNQNASSTSLAIALALWTHIAVVRDTTNNVIKFYKNGIFVQDIAYTEEATGATDPLDFFIGSTGTGSYFDGLIDEVRVWDDIRTAQEIHDNIFNDVTGQSNLQGYWKFDNNANDSSGNGTNLTLYNSPVYSSDVGFPNYRVLNPVALSETTLASDDNLVGYWKLDDTAIDESPNGYDLLNIGSPQYASGKFNNGVNLSGIVLDKALGAVSSTVAFATYYWRSQSFIPTTNYLSFIGIQLKKVGSPTGNLTIELYADDGAGNPTGSVLATNTIDSATLGTSYAEIIRVMDCPLTIGNVYHIVLKGQSAWDGSNDVNMGYLGGTFTNNYNHYGVGDLSGSQGATVQYSLNTYYSDALYITDASAPNLEISGSQSWFAWIKFDSIDTNGARILSKYVSGGYKMLDIASNATKYLRWQLNGLTPNNDSWSVSLLANTFYHVGFVYDASANTVNLYVNGILVKSTSVSGTPTDTNANFYIGAAQVFSTTSKRFWDGIIDDVALFNRVLTATEIFDLYTGAFNIKSINGIETKDIKSINGVAL